MQIQQQKSLKEDSADINNGVKGVNVISPHMASADSLLLPSNVRALEETQIYARTSGYLTKRYTADIGSRVKQGDVLAEIASPDVDQQEFQAKADQARAVATVGQSQADVQNKIAGVQETRSEVARSTAGVEQASSVRRIGIQTIANQGSPCFGRCKGRPDPASPRAAKSKLEAGGSTT